MTNASSARGPGSLLSGAVYIGTFAAGGVVTDSPWWVALARYWIGDAVGLIVTLPIVLGIAAAHVPESRGAAGASGGALDITGALLATVALGGIVFAFIEAPARGWTSAVVLGALAAGVAAGIALAVPLGVLASRKPRLEAALLGLAGMIDPPRKRAAAAAISSSLRFGSRSSARRS